MRVSLNFVSNKLKIEGACKMEERNKKEELEKAKSNFQDYLEGFDEEFETHTKERIKETPLLLKVFNEFVEEIYQPTQIYNLALKLRNQIKDEMEETFTIEQLKLIEQYQFYEDRMSDDMIEQAFIYGYAMNDELRYEAKKQYAKK